MLSLVLRNPFPRLRHAAAQVLLAKVEFSSRISADDNENEEFVLELLQGLHDTNACVATKVAEILTCLACAMLNRGAPSARRNVAVRILRALQTRFTSLGHVSNRALRRTLDCIVSLARRVLLSVAEQHDHQQQSVALLEVRAVVAGLLRHLKRADEPVGVRERLCRALASLMEMSGALDKGNGSSAIANKEDIVSLETVVRDAALSPLSLRCAALLALCAYDRGERNSAHGVSFKDSEALALCEHLIEDNRDSPSGKWELYLLAGRAAARARLSIFIRIISELTPSCVTTCSGAWMAALRYAGCAMIQMAVRLHGSASLARLPCTIRTRSLALRIHALIYASICHRCGQKHLCLSVLSNV